MLLVVLLFFGIFVSFAQASTFSIQTGYYVGTGASSHTISGLGFRPELVIIKADTTAGVGAVWKSSSMAAADTAFFTATANDSASMITFTDDGFVLSSAANVNTSDTIWKWIAFAGSDCTSSGTMCIGSYNGDGGASQAIASVGFQPDLVWVKPTTADVAATWKSSSMSNSIGQYFPATTQDTTGTLFSTLDPTGFTVGSTNNAALTYNFVAFKSTTGALKIGSFTGNGTAQSVTGVGFTSDFIFLKNADAATPRSAVLTTTESFGDFSNFFTDAAGGRNQITSIDADGFSVGSSIFSNGSGNKVYWASFGGAVDAVGTTSFKMASGSYNGFVGNHTISGLSFRPDLVIVKQASDTVTQNYAIFKTKMMRGGVSAYLSNPVLQISGGITLTSDGFTFSNSEILNGPGDTYYWTAFGNAFDPHDNSGAGNFAIGAYTGSAGDDRDIARLPFQPDLVTIKGNVASSSVWRSSAQTGDNSGFFDANIDVSNNIQALNADGFRIGTQGNVNSNGIVYYWFAFKNSENFKVGTYSGSGSPQNFTGVGIKPDLLWIKSIDAVNAVMKPASLTGDGTQFFTNLANVLDRVTSVLSNGFSLGGNQIETNSLGTNNYRYAAWTAQYDVLLKTDKYSYPGRADTINIELTAKNNFSIPVTGSYIDYVIFIDNDSDGVPDPGETYITENCLGYDVWSTNKYTHRSSHVNVYAITNDSWSCVSGHFPTNSSENRFTIWSKWWDGISETYDTGGLSFFSAPDPLASGYIKLAVDSITHRDYGLVYPVTYQFSIPPGSQNLKVFKRYNESQEWTQINEKNSNDLFNGVEAVRFDYQNNKAYVSVGFSSVSDEIHLLVLNNSSELVRAVYQDIPEYYDNRSAAVTITSDDWASLHDDSFVAAANAIRSRDMWFTPGIITQYVGSTTSWSLIQEHIDRGNIEPASHSRTHPSSLPYTDYDSEIGGSKLDIVNNLNMPPLNRSGDNEYIYAWIEPSGLSDSTIRIKLGQNKYLSDRSVLWDDVFSGWDNTNGTFDRIGVSYNYGNEDLTAANNKFDSVISLGGIYHLWGHPYSISWADGSWILDHLDHIKHRTNVWYAGFGHLYLYHYIDKQNKVKVSVVPYSSSPLASQSSFSSNSSSVSNQNSFVTNVNSSSTDIISNANNKFDTSKMFRFERSLRLGMSGEDVKKLQQFLNSKGFVLSKFGPGSPGNETSYFGSLTKAALMKFQQMNRKFTLDPQGLLYPTGFFGIDTKKYVNSVLERQ